MLLENMLIQAEPNVKALAAFLRILNVKVNINTIDETLYSHPDWPSLLSVSDALTKWNVPNGAGKIDHESVEELPTPFIALTRDKQAPMAIVTGINGTSIKRFQHNYKQEELVSKEVFFNNWDGSYLIAEPSKDSGEPDYTAAKKRYLIAALIPILAFGLIAILAV